MKLPSLRILLLILACVAIWTVILLAIENALAPVVCEADCLGNPRRSGGL